MYLFVYGTLRKSSGHAAHALLDKDCLYHSDGYFYGKVDNVAGYPAAIEHGNRREQVHGELYRILNAASLFARLDAYEECSATFPPPHVYWRKRITVYDKQHQRFQAWCYLHRVHNN